MSRLRPIPTRRSDVVTFELEGVSREVLEHLAARAAHGTLRVAPSPEIMLTLQNKALQKQWLSRHDFPTADYRLTDGAPPDLDAVLAHLGLPLVQMTAFAGYDGRVARTVTTLAEEVVASINGIGVFAVEMFVTNEHELLINVISPRMHNPGHLTLEACETSQFSQHLRAVTGQALGPVMQRRPAVMKNLLFTPALADLCRTDARSFVSGNGGAFVNWYGKKEERAMRKMGHVTALAADLAAADRTLRERIARDKEQLRATVMAKADKVSRRG